MITLNDRYFFECLKESLMGVSKLAEGRFNLNNADDCSCAVGVMMKHYPINTFLQMINSHDWGMLICETIRQNDNGPKNESDEERYSRILSWVDSRLRDAT